jgi:hypothetical protein
VVAFHGGPRGRARSAILQNNWEEEMTKKRYEVKGACPHCGCGTVSHLSADEIKAKTIDGDNLEVNCPECMEVHRANIRSVCPEYADECHL